MAQLIIGLSKRIGKFEPFSWAIMFFGKRSFSHAYIRFHSEEYDREMVYQASGVAVNFMEYGKFCQQEQVCAEFEINVSDATLLKTVQFAIDNVGEPYGMLEALGLGVYLMAKAVGIKLKGNPFASQTDTVCSKLVETVLNEIVQEDIQIDPNLVMPGDIFDIMSKNPAAKRIK